MAQSDDSLFVSQFSASTEIQSLATLVAEDASIVNVFGSIKGLFKFECQIEEFGRADGRWQGGVKSVFSADRAQWAGKEGPKSRYTTLDWDEIAKQREQRKFCTSS